MNGSDLHGWQKLRDDGRPFCSYVKSRFACRPHSVQLATSNRRLIVVSFRKCEPTHGMLLFKLDTFMTCQILAGISRLSPGDWKPIRVSLFDFAHRVDRGRHGADAGQSQELQRWERLWIHRALDTMTSGSGWAWRLVGSVGSRSYSSKFIQINQYESIYVYIHNLWCFYHR